MALAGSVPTMRPTPRVDGFLRRDTGVATRAEFLERIRKEVARTGGLFAASASARPERPEEAAEVVRRQMAERWAQALDRFREEFEKVAGVFHRAGRASEVPGLVLGIARDKGTRELVTWAPAALGLDLRPAAASAGIEVTFAEEVGEPARLRHRAEAARAGVGVTGVDFALAETGTLIVLSGVGRPRSTSLLPATHVAVFDRRRLLESLEQVGVMLEALHAEAGRSMSGAMINFITGPSRTADIELTLTRGVHGPKEVHAVFVDEPLETGA
jgi:L-lactate dehydrogenase complex protein LldG